MQVKVVVSTKRLENPQANEGDVVALARRLAVIMHRIWVDGTEFRWTRGQTAAAA